MRAFSWGGRGTKLRHCLLYGMYFRHHSIIVSGHDGHMGNAQHVAKRENRRVKLFLYPILGGKAKPLPPGFVLVLFTITTGPHI